MVEMPEGAKKFVDWLRTGQRADFCCGKHGKMNFNGFYLNLDLSGAEIDALGVSGFVCRLDVSDSKIKEVVLKGTFLVFDASNSKIGKLNKEQVDILIFDVSGHRK